MPPAGALGPGRSFKGRVDAALALAGFRRGGPGGGFPDGVGKGEEVIWAGTCGGSRHGQPHHFPAARDGQGPGVLFAQVVAVRLGIGCQGSQDRGGVGIHVRQSCHR